MELVGSRSQIEQRSTQRKVVVKSTTSQSSISGKTAILAVATILAVALTTPTTVPTAQSAEMPTLPDLPDPPAITGPYFPPFPPGVMSCSAQWNSRRATISQSHANLQKAIDRAYKAKCAPFNAAVDQKVAEIENHLDQILKKEERRLNWIILLYPNLNDPRITNLEKEIEGHEEAIEALKEQISKLQDDLGKIWDWRKKCLAWAGEKRLKSIEAADAEYQDCVANEQDDD